MPADAQRAFKEMITNDEYVNAEWLSLSATSLKDIWETPEEDYWDKLYAKQHTAQ
jgi:hypothetical protein